MTELLVDDHLISNSIEHIDWGQDPICLEIWDSRLLDVWYGWVSIRQAGDYALLLPPFAGWLADDWDYASPEFVRRGALLLDEARYTELRGLVAHASSSQPVPALPQAPGLRALTGWEAVQLLHWEAPGEALGRGRDWEPVQFQRESVLATDHSSDDEAVGALVRLIEAGLASEGPVALRPLSGGDVKVSFFLDRTPGFTEWQPLAIVEGQPRLLLVPGYFVEG